MFIGTYSCKLDSKGRFLIPKPYCKLLAQGAEESRVLYFALADKLRVYTQRDVQSYITQLQEIITPKNKKYVMSIMRYTIGEGYAQHSVTGRVAIPEFFMNYYHFMPREPIILGGVMDFFEISHPDD